MKQPLYQILSRFVYECDYQEHCNPLAVEKFKAMIEVYVREFIPQDPEIGKPYKLHLDQSGAECLVFTVVIRDITHRVTVRSSLRLGLQLVAKGEYPMEDKHFDQLKQALITRYEEALV